MPTRPSVTLWFDTLDVAADFASEAALAQQAASKPIDLYRATAKFTEIRLDDGNEQSPSQRESH